MISSEGKVVVILVAMLYHLRVAWGGFQPCVYVVSSEGRVVASLVAMWYHQRVGWLPAL